MSNLNWYVNELKELRQSLSEVVYDQVELKNARRTDNSLNKDLLNSKIAKNKTKITQLHKKIETIQYVLSHFERGRDKTYLEDNQEALVTLNKELANINTGLNDVRKIFTETVRVQTFLKRKKTSLSNYDQDQEMYEDQVAVVKNKIFINDMQARRSVLKKNYKSLDDVVFEFSQKSYSGNIPDLVKTTVA